MAESIKGLNLKVEGWWWHRDSMAEVLHTVAGVQFRWERMTWARAQTPEELWYELLDGGRELRWCRPSGYSATWWRNVP